MIGRSDRRMRMLCHRKLSLWYGRHDIQTESRRNIGSVSEIANNKKNTIKIYEKNN
jgi:hypothetical protein